MLFTGYVITPVDVELQNKQVLMLVQIALVYSFGRRPQNSAVFHQLKILPLISERK